MTTTAEEVSTCISTYSQQAYSTLYGCLAQVLCDGDATKPDIDGSLLQFDDFCAYRQCVSVDSKQDPTDDPCFRFACVAGSPVYEEYTWCGYAPTDPYKLIMPCLLIAALCLSVFLMACMSCQERSKKLTYLKSQSSYGKLEEDAPGNKH